MILRTMKFMTMPASSRSLILMSPFGLSSVTSLACMSFGHSSFHTTYGQLSVPGDHIPPAPNLQASLNPMKFGKSVTSWSTEHGLFFI